MALTGKKSASASEKESTPQTTTSKDNSFLETAESIPMIEVSEEYTSESGLNLQQALDEFISLTRNALGEQVVDLPCDKELFQAEPFILDGLVLLAEKLGLEGYDPEKVQTLRMSQNPETGNIYINGISIMSDGKNAVINWGQDQIPLNDDQSVMDTTFKLTSSANSGSVVTYRKMGMKFPVVFSPEARDDKQLQDKLIEVDTFGELKEYLRVAARIGNFRDVIDGSVLQITGLDAVGDRDDGSQYCILTTDYPDLVKAYAPTDDPDFWEGLEYPIQATREGQILHLKLVDGSEVSLAIGAIKVAELVPGQEYSIHRIEESRGQNGGYMLFTLLDGVEVPIKSNSPVTRKIDQFGDRYEATEDEPATLSIESVKESSMRDDPSRKYMRALGVKLLFAQEKEKHSGSLSFLEKLKQDAIKEQKATSKAKVSGKKAPF